MTAVGFGTGLEAVGNAPEDHRGSGLMLPCFPFACWAGLPGTAGGLPPLFRPTTPEVLLRLRCEQLSSSLNST